MPGKRKKQCLGAGKHGLEKESAKKKRNTAGPSGWFWVEKAVGGVQTNLKQF